MQNPNNNQGGQRPPFPGAVRPPQFNSQNGPVQMNLSTPSSSPFANPPPVSTGEKSQMNGMESMPQGSPIIRPGMPLRPPMQNQAFNSGTSLRPPIMMPRPPMPPQAPLGSQSQAIRPPIPSLNQSASPPAGSIPQFPRPSLPTPQNSQINSQASPFNRPPIAQISQESAGQRPPMPQSTVSSGSPFASPPVTSQSQSIRPQSPPAGMRPPAVGPMRPIPNGNAQTAGPMGPPVFTNNAQAIPYMRPPMPSGNAQALPSMRPPMPSGNPQAMPSMRPPMPSGNAQAMPSMRPPMPSGNAQDMPSMRPPRPLNQAGTNPFASNTFGGQPQMQGRPPMPMNPGMQFPSNGFPSVPSSSQIPPLTSPSSRYPPEPGYMQHQAPIQGRMHQTPAHSQLPQAGYPQSMPSAQQSYPSYPQTSNMQNVPQYPTQGFSGGNVAASPPTAPKVNPAAIPSVVSVLEADELRFKETGQPYYTFSSVAEHAPPLPTNRSVSIIDDGNSSPQFIRATMNHIPTTEEICENTKIPLCLLVQPFASNPQNDIPLVDFGASGPLRCNRCRAYINPHVQFIKGGRYFVCNMCEMANDVSEEYYANLDMSGKRIDLDLRSELKFGTVDFVASKEYLNKLAGKPHLLFVLDSSRAAVGCGAFQAAIESIRAFASNSQATQYYGGMAILVHDRTLTFYTLREGRNEPQVLVVGDVFDPFVPLHAIDLYFDPVKCASGLTVLLNHLSSSMTLESRSVDSCFGAAVSVALESLKVRGGRAVFFQTSLPSYGPGALKNRESGGPGSVAAPADKANPLLFPQGDYYTKLAVQAAEQGVSMSIVSTPAAHIDLATIGVLSNTTSGSLLHYSRFSPQQHLGRLVGDVLGLLSSSFAFDCLVRIRCNSGLQVRKHYGHFYASSNGHDLSFGTISSDQSFAASLEYDGKLSEKTRAAFQIAVLHTDAFSGQRRIRVLNLALPCTSSIQTIFKMAELDSILAFYVKKNVSQILEAPSPAFPASFSAKCSNILAAYRKYCAANMSSGQLILPDSLKLFPVMTLAIHKDPAFNDAPKSADSRWYSIHRLSDMSLSMTMGHFYPQLFPLSNILEHGEILPACIRLSREHVSREGIYLMNNGDTLTLYIGDSADPNALKEIFGVSQLNALNLANSNLPVLQNSRSAKLRQIITVLRSQNFPRHLNLRLIRQSVDIAEDAEFAGLLVEDASSLSPSYVDFLCRIHSTIQHTISQGASISLAERTSMLSFLQ